MRYYFKDLNLTVSASGGPHCPSCSVISCRLPTVACGPITCGITSVIHQKEAEFKEFDALKLELQQALDVVKATAEMESETQLEPQTVEEAEELERTLGEALEAVRETKSKLQGGKS
jgi:hypothetical protein